jgi:hypothetical protein
MLTIKNAKELARPNGFTNLTTRPDGNSKLAKSTGYYNAGISLAQASLSGYNVCFGSTPQCRAACLGQTGRAEFTPNIEIVRINRTKLYVENRELFWQILETELHAIDRKAKRKGVNVAFRPNILSDQNWVLTMPQMFEAFPHWQFYGYTKVKSTVSAKIAGTLPQNYHITYSWSERATLDYVDYCLRNGINVAVPFYDAKTLRPTLPTSWHGWRVIDGDKSDLRFLDPKGVIVGLKVKLPKKRKLAIEKIKESKGFFVGV